jgi:dihydrofolate reductase
MQIKARMGMSIDGFIATSDGMPAFLKARDFVPGESHGYREFVAGCDAVAMGRNTFVPALGAPSWPWGDMTVFVLTSTSLPAGTPNGVVAANGGPAQLIELLRARGSDGDVHLVGGPLTIQAIAQTGALDRLEVVVLPVLLGSGVTLWPGQFEPPSLRLGSEPRTFPDGSVELAYSPSDR